MVRAHECPAGMWHFQVSLNFRFSIENKILSKEIQKFPVNGNAGTPGKVTSLQAISGLLSYVVSGIIQGIHDSEFRVLIGRFSSHYL